MLVAWRVPRNLKAGGSWMECLVAKGVFGVDGVGLELLTSASAVVRRCQSQRGEASSRFALVGVFIAIFRRCSSL